MNDYDPWKANKKKEQPEDRGLQEQTYDTAI